MWGWGREEFEGVGGVEVGMVGGGIGVVVGEVGNDGVVMLELWVNMWEQRCG